MHLPVETQAAEDLPVSKTRPSIASVTVAYNGAASLREHLESLMRQSRTLNEIVVVDNGSRDGTQELLATEYPNITVLRLRENTGIAGGLAAGLTYAALKKKYDWIWLFDQDSFPAPDALERLIDGLRGIRDDTEEIAMLGPVCVHAATDKIWPSMSWRGPRLMPTLADPNRPITFVDSIISSGTLLRRTAVEAAGLPNTDFFMDFVDHEYCLRLRRRGFRIAVVRGSMLHHALGNPTKFKIWGRTKFWTDHAPWREYYMIRNEVFSIWRDYPNWSVKGFTVLRLARHVLDLLLFGKQKFACLGMICRGLFDGLSGKLGIRFLPVEPIGASESARIVDQFAQRGAQSQECGRSLHQTSRGNGM
jgi:GT2 family glycosyltransferase